MDRIDRRKPWPRWLWVWCLLVWLISPELQAASHTIPWPALVTDAARYGFPMPPKQARLVVYEAARTYTSRKRWVPMFQFGFAVSKLSQTKVKALVGPITTTLYGPKLRAVKPSFRPTGKLYVEIASSHFGLNGALVTAIQCHARGWHQLAEYLWRKSVTRMTGHPFSIFVHKGGLAPRLALARVAWAHYASLLTKPKSDRAKIFHAIQDLLRRFPTIKTRRSSHFLRSLQKTVHHKSSHGPGTVAGLIDRLSEETMAHKKNSFEPPTSPYQRLERLGFKAVPALINALGDERLTRSVMVGFNNFPTYHRRVGALVSDLIQHLAGSDLGRNWLRRQQGWKVKRAKALAWWQKAQKIGEETYLTTRVLKARPRSKWPQMAMLRIIASHYPRRLPGIYQKLLQHHPQLQSYPVAQAISSSKLPKATKIALFQAAAKHPKREHVRAALWELAALAPKAFAKHLIQQMKTFPKTPKQPYWRCREAAFANLVMKTADAQVWKVFTDTARRVDVGLRMQLIAPMTYAHKGNANKPQRMAFLASFLNDKTIRDASSNRRMYSGPHAAMTYPKLEVRNYAAMQLAWLLGLKTRPKKGWRATQWQQYRKQVRQLYKAKKP